MRLNLVTAVMFVMGRLGIWEPYLHFVDSILKLLDNACYEEFGPLWWETMEDLESMI